MGVTELLLTQPLYLIGIVLLAVLYRNQGQQERFSFLVRKRPWFGKWIKSIGLGIATGLLLSIFFAFVGAQLQPLTVLWIWAIALVLLILRIRLFSFTYAIVLLILLHHAAVIVPEWFDMQWEASGWIESLTEIHAPALLLLAGFMLGVEAMMYRFQTSRHASPLYLHGKRGKPVGGFHLMQFLPVPLVMFVPTAAATGVDLYWTPLMFSDASGWMLLPLPVMLGYNSWTAVQLPKEKAKTNAIWLLCIAVILIAVSLGSVWQPWLTTVGAVLFLLLRELVVWKSARDERTLPPRFVTGSDGLKVLDVIAGSPADKLGIVPGEILYRVNGIKPRTVEELHKALQHSSAYCKLEVTNLNGESKFLNRAIYTGDHHLLGVLVAPDDRSKALPPKATESLWGMKNYRKRVKKVKTVQSDEHKNAAQ